METLNRKLGEMVLQGLWNRIKGVIYRKNQYKMRHAAWDVVLLDSFFFFLMIHFWVRCQGLGRRRLYFFPWLNESQGTSWIPGDHSFPLCAWGCLLRTELCAAVTPECCLGGQWDWPQGCEHWFLGQRAAEIGGHQVLATPLGRVSRVLCKLPGFALLRLGSPAAAKALLLFTAQAALQHHWSNHRHPCLPSSNSLPQFPFISAQFRPTVRHVVKGDHL